jgi:hypothetical protein
VWTLVDRMMLIFNPLTEHTFSWNQQCIL